LITVDAEQVRHCAPLAAMDAVIPRETGPLRLSVGQATDAKASFWNNCDLSTRFRRSEVRETLNVQPQTERERIDERQQWFDLATQQQQSSNPTNRRGKSDE
jgi:hypothetical protein